MLQFKRFLKIKIPPQARADSSPNPSSARGTKSEFSREKISLGFAKSKSPENSLAKPSPSNGYLEFRQFLLWRNPTSPATTIPNSKRENPRQIKIECVVARRGRNGTAEAEADCRARQSGGAEAVP